MATTSFARDIKPLFTDADVTAMKKFDGRFDLHDYDDVKDHADCIYTKTKDGTMPPPRTGRRWGNDKVNLFKKWMDEGYPE